MILPADAYHRAAHQLPVHAVFGGVFLEGEEQLDLPVGHQVVQSAGREEPKQGKNVRRLLPQAVQGGAYQPEVGGAAAADLQPGGPGGLTALDLDLGGLCQLEHFPRVLQKQMARLGQADGFAGTAEQLDPQFILQCLDLVADGGLGDPQMLRRPGKIQKVRHRHETLQLCRIQPNHSLLSGAFCVMHKNNKSLLLIIADLHFTYKGRCAINSKVPNN